MFLNWSWVVLVLVVLRTRECCEMDLRSVSQGLGKWSGGLEGKSSTQLRSTEPTWRFRFRLTVFRIMSHAPIIE